ncbi:MAG: response regulator [Gemmatimonadota bacterium]
MIRVVIVDDEGPSRERVRGLLTRHPGIEIVGEADDGSSAVERISELGPDLVFLDVQMPGLSGFEVLEALADEVPPAVVFVTAYDEYAIQAFDRHAVDYLLKPIVPARFEQAVERALERLAGRPASDPDVRKLIEERMIGRPGPRRFAARVGGKIRLIADDLVEWIEGAGNYVRLHTATERFPIRAAIKDLERTLDSARFARIHRSAIVRLTAIHTVEPAGDGEYLVVLRSGARIRSSRRYGPVLRGLIR